MDTPQFFEAAIYPATTPNIRRNIVSTVGVALLFGAFVFSLSL